VTDDDDNNDYVLFSHFLNKQGWQRKYNVTWHVRVKTFPMGKQQNIPFEMSLNNVIREIRGLASAATPAILRFFVSFLSPPRNTTRPSALPVPKLSPICRPPTILNDSAVK
jgi:hypothetical protein